MSAGRDVRRHWDNAGHAGPLQLQRTGAPRRSRADATAGTGNWELETGNWKLETDPLSKRLTQMVACSG
jgi:hypothetical protein